MKKLLLFAIGLLFSVTAISQRVGVGTVTPSHYFHVLPPAGSGDPVRIEGLQAFNSETDVLVVDPTSGVIRTLPFQQLLDMDTVYFNDTSYMLITDSILADTIFLDSLINLIGDSINTDNQNIDSLTIVGTILTVFIEDGNSASINIQNSVDSLIFAKSDTLYSIITDSALNDTLWIRQLDSLLGIYGDTIFFNDTSYSLIKDSLLKDSLFLDSLIGLIGDSINTDDQNIDSVRLNGTILTVYIEDGNSANIDLQPIVDSALANETDDQMLTLGVGTATTSIIDIESSTSDITIQEGPGIQLTEAGNTLTITGDQDIDSVTLNGTDLRVYIENGLSANVDLQPIVDSALANVPAGSDDQNIDSVTLSGNILEVYIENGTSATVDLSVLNNPGSDDQNIDSLRLNGTILTTYIENGLSANIDLQPIIDSALNNVPAGSDDQNIDSVTLTGNILEVYIENGTSATVDLSTLNNTGTDDQNIDSVILTGNILEVFIENGTSATVDLSTLNNTGTDDQNIDSLRLNGTILTTYIENGLSSNIDLQPIIDSALANVPSGSDDQNIDSVTLTGNILEVYIENGTSATVDLSSLNNTGTDDQNIDSVVLTGNILEVFIENGTSATVDLSSLNNTGTDDQNIDSIRLNGTILTTYIESGASANIDLQPIIDSAIANASGADNDWDINGNGTGLEGNPGVNTASGTNSIAAGDGNVASGDYSIVFGLNDTTQSWSSTVSGGNENAIDNLSDITTISGGQFNKINSSQEATISGGFSNEINNSIGSMINGGADNQINNSQYATAGGGFNTISADYGSITGGGGNTITSNGFSATIAGGRNNNVDAWGASIIGGEWNTANGDFSSVGNGTRNTAHSFGEWVGGLFSTNYAASSTSAWVGTDRLFVVGNGTSTAARSNALTLYKDGRLEINEAYTLPNADGGAGQVLRTDGSGNVSWGTIAADNDWDINANGSGLEAAAAGNNNSTGTNALTAGERNDATGIDAVAIGYQNDATNDQAIAMGRWAVASNQQAVALGRSNTSSGWVSFSTGDGGIASGSTSFVAGSYSTATATSAIAMGGNSTAQGNQSFVTGYLDSAMAQKSNVSGGERNKASGDYSAVSGGREVKALSYGEWAGGLYSTLYSPSSTSSWVGTDRLFVVGNGTSTAARSNALILYKDGSLEINEAYTLPNVDGGTGQVLQTDGAGNISWGNGGVTNNIYTADGNLTGDRVLYADSNRLRFTQFKELTFDTDDSPGEIVFASEYGGIQSDVNYEGFHARGDAPRTGGPFNVLFEDDSVTLGDYPNNRDDRETAVNFLTTNSQGVLKSLPVDSMASAIGANCHYMYIDKQGVYTTSEDVHIPENAELVLVNGSLIGMGALTNNHTISVTDAITALPIANGTIPIGSSNADATIINPTLSKGQIFRVSIGGPGGATNWSVTCKVRVCD